MYVTLKKHHPKRAIDYLRHITQACVLALWLEYCYGIIFRFQHVYTLSEGRVNTLSGDNSYNLTQASTNVKCQLSNIWYILFTSSCCNTDPLCCPYPLGASSS